MFKYKLQVPLDVRKRLEEKRRVEYAVAMSKVVKERGELGSLGEKYSDTSETYLQWQQEGVDMEIIKLFRPYFNRLKLEQRMKGVSIEQRMKEAEGKRVVLGEAVKKRRALEILRDKKRSQYFLEMDRKEQKMADESAVNFYLRRKDEV